MNAIELAEYLEDYSEYERATDIEAAAMLRRQHEVILKLRVALGTLSYATEWGVDLDSAQDDAESTEIHGGFEMIDTKAIRAAAEAATKGEWLEMKGCSFDPEVVITTKHRADRKMHHVCALDVGFSGEMSIEQKANAKHIATANPATILALLDRLEAAEKDAARYRWLRDTGDETWIPLKSRLCGSNKAEAHIDAAIDAAMKEQK